MRRYLATQYSGDFHPNKQFFVIVTKSSTLSETLLQIIVLSIDLLTSTLHVIENRFLLKMNA